MLKGNTNRVCIIAKRPSLDTKGKDKLLLLILTIKLIKLIIILIMLYSNN
jgi:hypothetical protein